MKIGWLLLALLMGMLIPTQALMNAKMRTFVVNPMYSSLINFAVGGVLVLVATSIALTLGQQGHWRGVQKAPWWAWLGGFIGVAFVTCTVLIMPKTGNAAFTVAVIFGQMVGAVLLDQYGWLDNPRKPADLQRWLGVACVLVGVWLVVSKNAAAVPAPEASTTSVEQ